MKILKYLFFLLLIIFIGASIYIATKNGSYQVQEQRMIAAPQEVLYNEVNDLTTWKEWEPWWNGAEDMIINYGDKTIGEGANYEWSSEEMGDGSLVTTKANPHGSIEQQVTFKTTFGESTSVISWSFEKQNDSILTTWTLKGDQTFLEKAAFLFEDESMTQRLQPVFKQGLDNLEEQIRKEIESYSINVDGVTQHGGGYYLYITTASRLSQIAGKMEDMTNDVSNFMNSNNIEMTGKPFILFNERNEDRGTAIYSAAYFTPSEVITPQDSQVLNGFMPNQKTLKTTLKGDYEYLQEAWDAAYQYIQENDLVVMEDAEFFQVHVTGPKDNANPAEWITHLYIPLGEKETALDD